MPGRKSKQPAFVQSCVKQVLTNDPSRSVGSAFAICTASAQRAGQLVPGTRHVTALGELKLAGYGADRRRAIERQYEAVIGRKNPSESYETALQKMRDVSVAYNYHLAVNDGRDKAFRYAIMTTLSSPVQFIMILSESKRGSYHVEVRTGVYGAKGRAGSPTPTEKFESYIFPDFDSAWMYMQRMMNVATHHGLYGARVRMTHANRGPHYGKGDPLPLPGGDDRMTRKNPARTNDRILERMKAKGGKDGLVFEDSIVRNRSSQGTIPGDWGSAALEYAMPDGASIGMLYSANELYRRHTPVSVYYYVFGKEPVSWKFSSFEDAWTYMQRLIQIMTTPRGQLNVRTRTYPIHGGDPVGLPEPRKNPSEPHKRPISQQFAEGRARLHAHQQQQAATLHPIAAKYEPLRVGMQQVSPGRTRIIYMIERETFIIEHESSGAFRVLSPGAISPTVYSLEGAMQTFEEHVGRRQRMRSSKHNGR